MKRTIVALAIVPILLAALGGWRKPTRAATQGVAAPMLKWQKGGCRTTWCRTGWYASPAVADLDGDGKAEVIWADYRIVVVKGEDGSDKWIMNNPGNGRSWPSVVVADIDSDSKLEIVTAHSDGWVTVTRANGTTFAGWPQRPTPGNELRSLAVGDVDGNGDLEILVGSTRSDNQWFIYEHTGLARAGWPQQTDSDANGYAAGCYNENVGLADLDGDGRLEMIGPNDTHYVAGFKDNAMPLRADAIYGQTSGQNKTWARVGFHYSHAVDLRGYANCNPGKLPLEPRPNFADSAPTIADLNGDGIPELIIIGNQYDCRTDPYTDLFQMPYILRANRTRWAGSGFDWTDLPAPDAGASPLSEDYNNIETVMPNPAVADLDGDGIREILYASYDGRLHAYWLDRKEHGYWPYRITRQGDAFIRFGSEPAIVDLDNDGKAEVILATWTQKGSNATGQLLILSWDGILQHAVDLPRDPNQSWDGAMAAPTVANIDLDSDLEVVIGTAHTGLAAFDLPGTANARVLWGTGRGTYLRTGTPPSISAIVPPGAATLLSPSGAIAATAPSYTWNAVPASTFYYLWVNDSAGTRIQQWYTASQSGCAAATGTCSVTPSASLASGNATWWIQTWNNNGYGPWSAGMGFIANAAVPPSAANLISPAGTIVTTTPTYTWDAVSGSTWYYLWVNDSTGNKIKQWYTTAQAGCPSGIGTCSITPSLALAAGAARWWIQTWNDYGYGPWSIPMPFVVPMTTAR